MGTFDFDIEDPTFKRLRAEARKRTEAEADPWGGTVDPEDRRFREAQEVIKRQGATPPGLGIGPMPDDPLLTARDAEALAQREFRQAFMAKQPFQRAAYPREYDLPFPAEPSEMLPVAPGEAATAGQLDPTGREFKQSLLTREQQAAGLIARYGDVPEELGIPGMEPVWSPYGTVEPKPAFATEDVPIDFARALMTGLHVTNKMIEPLEVLTETITELLGGNKPTLFKEGWSAAVEDHRKRSVIEQIALGFIFDPFILFKTLTLSAKATAIAVRSLRMAGTGPAKQALQKFIPSTIQGKELENLLNQLVDVAREPGMDTVTFQNRAETLVQGVVDAQRRGPDVGSPAAVTPDVGLPAAVTPGPAGASAKIYHGTRSGEVSAFVNENGDLVLKASENFGGKQIGISFSSDLATAQDYASRVPGQGPLRSQAQGMVFEIDSNAIPAKLTQQAADELSTTGLQDVVIPKGRFRIIRDIEASSALSKWEAEQVGLAQNRSTQELAQRSLKATERSEFAEAFLEFEDVSGRAVPGLTSDIFAKYGSSSPEATFDFNELANRVRTDPQGTARDIRTGFDASPGSPFNDGGKSLIEDIQRQVPAAREAEIAAGQGELAAAPAPVAAAPEAAARTPLDPSSRSYNEWQKSIDDMEDQLEEQGMDVMRLMFPEEAAAGVELLPGYQVMPDELGQLYKARDAVGTVEDAAELDANLARVSEASLAGPAFPVQRSTLERYLRDAQSRKNLRLAMGRGEKLSGEDKIRVIKDIYQVIRRDAPREMSGLREMTLDEVLEDIKRPQFSLWARPQELKNVVHQLRAIGSDLFGIPMDDLPGVPLEAPSPAAAPSPAKEQVRVLVPDDPSQYGQRIYAGGITQPSGEIVRGTPISLDDPVIPDTVYHMTTNAPAVRASGILRASGEGGLGGAKRDQIVSFTINPDIAYQLVDDMKLSSEIARMGRGEWKSPERIASSREILARLTENMQSEGWTSSGFSRFVDDPEVSFLYGDYTPTEWLNQYFSYRESATTKLGAKKRNPLLFTDVESLARVNPDNIAVIEVPKSSLRTGAMVTDLDLTNPYGLQEIRIYGDVPVSPEAVPPGTTVSETVIYRGAEAERVAREGLPIARQGSDDISIPTPAAEAGVIPPAGVVPEAAGVVPPAAPPPSVGPQPPMGDLPPRLMESLLQGAESPPPQALPPASPPMPPDPPGSNLGKFDNMWEGNRKRTPFNPSDTYRTIMEYMNDSYWGLRKLQSEVGKRITITPGGEKDLVTLLTRGPGAAHAGATRYMLISKEIQQVAPDILVSDIDTILAANHGIEVMAAKGPSRVIAGGFTTADELMDALSTLRARMGDEAYDRAEQAAKIVRRVYSEERLRLVETGYISAEDAAILAEQYPWYNPIQYVKYAEDQARQGRAVTPFTPTRSPIRRLSDVGSTDAIRSPLEILGEQLIRNEVAILKNDTANAIISLAREDPSLGVVKVNPARLVAKVGDTEIFRPTSQDIPGTLSRWVDGKREIYAVPDWITKEAQVLNQTIRHPVAIIAGALNGISRAAFTTFNPAFVVGNMLNDMLVASISRGILPHQTGAQLLRSLRGVSQDPIMQAFNLAGGRQKRIFGRDVAELTRDVGLSGGKVIGDNVSLRRAILDAIPRAGEVTEQAPRIALFRREIRNKLPNWQNMTPEEIAATPVAHKAAADAVELTINFARGAYLIKSLNPFIIFLNAAMEGTKLPLRLLVTNPSGKRSVAMRLAAVCGGMVGLTTYNLSYPEYLDIPDKIRWGSVVVMLPSKEKDINGNPKPNYVTVVPKTREWAAFLGPITYSMEKLFSSNPTGIGEFTKTVVPQLSPVNTIPAPQVLAELFGQAANWDFYWNSPIVPTNVKDLPTTEQVTNWTSRTVQEIAEKGGISPVRLQHAMSSIFGGAGKNVTSVTDYILDMLVPKETDPRIQQLILDYEALEDPTSRQAMLTKLDSIDRETLLKAVRQPDVLIPIVGPVVKRVVPGRGGQLYATGARQAEEVTGLSAQQTSDVGRKLQGISDRFLDDQKESDARLDAGKISAEMWRDARSNQGREYEGVLKLLEIEFPKAAQVQRDSSLVAQYYDTIATVANSTADRRTRSQILAAGWYGIPLNDSIPEDPDYASFFKMRDEYRNNLSEEDRQLLDTHLDARKTPKEQEFQQDLDSLEPYWIIGDYLVVPSLPTNQQVAYKYWKNSSRTERQEIMEDDQNRSMINDARNQINDARFDFIVNHPDLIDLLRKWEFGTSQQLRRYSDWLKANAVGATP